MSDHTHAPQPLPVTHAMLYEQLGRKQYLLELADQIVERLQADLRAAQADLDEMRQQGDDLLEIADLRAIDGAEDPGV